MNKQHKSDPLVRRLNRMDDYRSRILNIRNKADKAWREQHPKGVTQDNFELYRQFILNWKPEPR